MYLMAKEIKEVKIQNNITVNLNLAEVWKIVRSFGCKPGDYALYKRDDDNKFSTFVGYITFDEVCKYFEMIHLKTA